ncbi:13294_t:CDS:2 [Dentiscutata erythropus]|uniref:13294_t:CDS:1 n=1 Tax=Dentiscutata erythropus TaxID=1348616 RepID=A0A9N8ZFT9_9GLOM|nr:13294_t:CDS:2 [Dentiscutata erythropus]
MEEESQEAPRRQPTCFSSLKEYATCSYFNLVLLIFIPLGIIGKFHVWSDTAVFILNSLAIISLSGLLFKATEEIVLRAGWNVGGLLSAVFGNTVEFIISIIALNEGHKEQEFNLTAAQMSGSILALTVLSLVVPAAYSSTTENESAAREGLLILSHGTAIILLMMYFQYLHFQLSSHKELYEDEEKPKTTLLATLTVIDGLVENLKISTTFVGIILIPIVGNFTDLMSSVIFALKNRMNVSIQIALGSSMQIALGVTPVLILIGWIINQPLTLFFETFETCVLVVAVLIVNYSIQDGRSNWLEGEMLLVNISLMLTVLRDNVHARDVWYIS